MKMSKKGDAANIKQGSSFNLPSNSSLPAITHLRQSKTKARKTLYFLLFIVSLIVCCHHIYNFMNVYFWYPVLTFMEVESKLNAEFPAVTVCNLNRVLQYNVKNVLNNISYTEEVPEIKSEVGGGVLVLTERQSINTLKHTPNASSPALHERLSSFYNAFTNLDDFIRENYGHRLYFMIAACRFGSELCHESNFTLFQSFQYGNCYTFNKRKDFDDPRLKSRRAGSDFGLELILDLEIENYMDITPSVGMRVVIHGADEDPDPSENGVTISPGFETHIAMTRTSIRRLPAPYRDRCFDYKSKESMFSSQLECIRNCQQEASLSRCSCVEPFLPTRKLGSRRCDLQNASEMTCLNAVVEDMRKNGFPCECPITCIVNSFDTEIFSSVWTEHEDSNFFPSYELLRSPWRNQSFQPIFNFYNSDSEEINFFGEDKSNISNDSEMFFNPSNFSEIPVNDTGIDIPSWYSSPNFSDQYDDPISVFDDVDFDYKSNDSVEPEKKKRAKIKVFFKNFDRTIYSQSPMLTESEIISHIGGLLNFWLGFTILTFYEYLEIAILFLKTLCTRYN